MDQTSNRLQQIGNVCVQWSNLEYQLAACIWTMTNMPVGVGQIMTASADAKARATMAWAIADEIKAPFYIRTVIKSALQAIRDELLYGRNQAVHGIHMGSYGAGTAKIEMHRGKGGRGMREQTDESLRSLAAKIHAHAKAIGEATLRLRSEKMTEYDGAKALINMVRTMSESPISDDGK